jgi:PBP1b-binding outer membrane lipoprotein LpoB
MRLILILALLIASCSPAKLIERAVKKDPTILQVDTVKIPTLEIDTFTLIERDTILKIKLDSIIQYLPDTCVKVIRTEFYPVLDDYVPSCIDEQVVFSDTIENDSMRLELSMILYQINDTLFINTILENAEIYTNSISVEDNKIPIWVYLVGALLIVIIIIRR